MNEVKAYSSITGFNIPPNVSVSSLDKERQVKYKEEKKKNIKPYKGDKPVFLLFDEK